MTEKTKFDYLSEIESKIKIGKDERNDFGGFNYRNAEAMLTQLKPIARESGCIITLDESLIHEGDRFYIAATATLVTPAGDIVAHGHAREQDTKKGSDPAQITGMASSYSKKYALQNLFAIDDGKADPDSMDNSAEGDPAQTPITDGQIKILQAQADAVGSNMIDIVNAYVPGGTVNDMTAAMYADALRKLKVKAERQGVQ